MYKGARIFSVLKVYVHTVYSKSYEHSSSFDIFNRYFLVPLQLTEASEIVTEEMHKLDHSADSAFDVVNVRFQSVLDHVERARQEALQAVRDKRDEKKKVLEDQMQIIQAEKTKSCRGRCCFAIHRQTAPRYDCP